MGTSSSAGGPSGQSSLLPSYYNPTPLEIAPLVSPQSNDIDGEPGDNEPKSGNSSQPQQFAGQELPILSKNWGNAKSSFTRFTKGTAGSSIKKAGRSYVKTLGGARGATRSASRGVSAGGGLIHFLGSVSTTSGGAGLNSTLTELGLSDQIGKSSEAILAKVADAIAPIGATNDEAIARDSILTTLDKLYDKILDAGGDLNQLESLSADMIKETVIEYVGTYIFNKWLYELGIAVEKNAVSEKEAIQMETEIRDFIIGEVKLSLSGKDIKDFKLNTVDNQQVINNIFNAAYSTIEQ